MFPLLMFNSFDVRGSSIVNLIIPQKYQAFAATTAESFLATLDNYRVYSDHLRIGLGKKITFKI